MEYNCGSFVKGQSLFLLLGNKLCITKITDLKQEAEGKGGTNKKTTV